jgi:hypothetical protein
VDDMTDPEARISGYSTSPPSGPDAPPGPSPTHSTQQSDPPCFQPAGARGHHHQGSWLLAVLLIVAGIVFLIKNTGWLGSDWSLNNWWALFILIPAFGSFGNAWRSYQGAGRRIDRSVARSVMFGLLFVAITIVLLFNLSWDKFWPVILIIVGLGMLLSWRRST